MSIEPEETTRAEPSATDILNATLESEQPKADAAVETNEDGNAVGDGGTQSFSAESEPLADDGEHAAVGVAVKAIGTDPGI
jgi:hypothetical protein